MEFGDKFSPEYFKGDTLAKSSFLSTNITSSCVSSCRDAFFSLVDTCEISDFSKSFVRSCYSSLNPLFFVLPTSTGGKYHGGQLSPENSVGGFVHHVSRVLAVSERVIDRYVEVLNRNSLSEFNNYVEVLRVAILLHDIGRLGADGSGLFSNKEHGEIGAEIVAKVSKSIKVDDCPFGFYIFPLIHAIHYHMYLWKFQNVWNQILNPNESFVNLTVGLMLSESEFFSTVY